MNTNEPITGLSLKVERVGRRLRANRVAEAMGISPSRVYALEREQFPSPDMIARYVAALDTCAPTPTSSQKGVL